MTIPFGFRPAVQQVRETLVQQRDKLRSHHQRGAPGIQQCTRWTQVCDDALGLLLEDALNFAGPSVGPFAIIAHGGYGRRDIAPYSDIDLMLLHGERQTEQMAELAKHLSRNIYDAGFKLGFSVRTASESIAESQRDASVFTSLVESRFLAGEMDLFAGFWVRFRRFMRRRADRLIASIIEARRAERRRFGDTVYLLEPNVKRSRGALRDIQLVRWIGGARYGMTNPDQLMRQGLLNANDYRDLTNAHAFLLRLRNELHLNANHAQDVLTRDEQLRIADEIGYESTELVRPVESFMREYFGHTRAVRDTSRNFVDRMRAHSKTIDLIEPFISRRIGSEYLVGPIHIRARAKTQERLTHDLTEVLRLMDLANWYDKWIDHKTWHVVREGMQDRNDIELSSDMIKRFISFLSHPARLPDLLRRLHDLRILEIFIPAMEHARCLVQFNEYHKYTVDEHCLLAVQRATEFESRTDVLGDAYRTLPDKHLLHLALLLHDLGKGRPGDHSEVGGELAVETGQRLELSSRQTAMVKLLVEKHLLMSHLALQHNINDETIWLQLAREVGSPFGLQMLYVLTCADLAAVGPGVLNSWKVELLTELYLRTREHLTQDLGDRPGQTIAAQRKEELRELILKNPNDLELLDHVERLPTGFLLADVPEKSLMTLKRVVQRDPDAVVAWSEYLPHRKAVAYTVAAPDTVAQGVFHRLTGSLNSQGLGILAAEIYTLGDDVALDRFFVEDPDFDGEPPPHRMEEVCQKLCMSLLEPSNEPPAFRRTWQDQGVAEQLQDMPPRVRFDNATSPKRTIITVFTYDRIGLLYEIARTLFELGLSVRSAKIGTHLDQVTDVFYVEDQSGQKITDEAEIERIREVLLAAVSV